MTKQIVRGWDAIEMKEKNVTVILNKYADPTEGACEDVTIEQAAKLAQEDAGLIWAEVTEGNAPSAAIQ